MIGEANDWTVFFDILLSPGRGAGPPAPVIAAVHAILADGKARKAEEICREAVARKLLPAATTSKYVRNAVTALIMRERFHGEPEEFEHLQSGEFRLKPRPAEPFSKHADAQASHPDVEALIDHLGKSARRQIAPDPADGPNTGAPFERDVCAALAAFGLIATRMGGEREPDVIAIAPMGAAAFSVAFECKSEEGPGAYHKNYALGASEAARMKESVHADYAVLVLVDPPLEQALDFELRSHGVALWTADDLCALLVANADHAIAWPDLSPLLQAGRRSEDITEFCRQHVHGAWQRAHVAAVYTFEELLRYQRSLVTSDLSALRVKAAVDVDALTYMVNERLTKEGDVGRLGVEDVRQAVAYLSAPTVGAVRVEDDGQRGRDRRLQGAVGVARWVKCTGVPERICVDAVIT